MPAPSSQAEIIPSFTLFILRYLTLLILIGIGVVTLGLLFQPHDGCFDSVIANFENIYVHDVRFNAEGCSVIGNSSEGCKHIAAESIILIARELDIKLLCNILNQSAAANASVAVRKVNNIFLRLNDIILIVKIADKLLNKIVHR